MYNTLKLYDEIVIKYFKTISYLKNKLENDVMEYIKANELRKVLNILELEDSDI